MIPKEIGVGRHPGHLHQGCNELYLSEAEMPIDAEGGHDQSACSLLLKYDLGCIFYIYVRQCLLCQV